LSPNQLSALLGQFERNGWSFAKPGHLTFSVRQHDMVFVNSAGQPIIPALSWQCNKATAETAMLNNQVVVTNSVGRIEERFILAKAPWALSQDGSIKPQVKRVMTTGDYVAMCLTGKSRLSTSDAVSNGLLCQATKQLAVDAIKIAGLDPDWFPRVIDSGSPIGDVVLPAADSPWRGLAEKLFGWTILASLGDNHAGAASCLGEDDLDAIVASFGTSGTINRICSPDANLTGEASCFEFFRQRLLLSMMAECADWYDKFRQDFLPADLRDDHEQINLMAAQAFQESDKLLLVSYQGGNVGYPDEFADLETGEQIASVQLSIVREMLRHALLIVRETEGKINRCILVGGLTQAPLIQAGFKAGLKMIDPGAQLLISDRSPELASQGAAMGALVTSLGGVMNSRSTALKELCSLQECDTPDWYDERKLKGWFFSESLPK